MPLSCRPAFVFLRRAVLAATLLLAATPAAQASFGSTHHPGRRDEDAGLLARGGGGGYGLGGGKGWDLDSGYGGGGRGSKAYDPYGKDDPYSTKGSKAGALYGGDGGNRRKPVQQSLHGPDRDRMKVAHDKSAKQRGRGDGEDEGYDHSRNIDRDRESTKVRGGTTADDSSSGSGDDSQ